MFTQFSTGVNQWKNILVLSYPGSVISRIKANTPLSPLTWWTFIPSISIDLLTAALNFVSNYDKITDEKRQIIIHAKKSYLYHLNEHWGKKDPANHFDVTMGSYDGAESCELAGSFLHHQIKMNHVKGFGLYRDDGLGIIKATPREVENIKKSLCFIFQTYGLKITIEANKKVVNFLDVTLNLNTGKFHPYSKPNNTPLYVHNKSNHPPTTLRNIPLAINKRLTEISSDEESFRLASQTYQAAPDKSGYKHQLMFKHPLNTTAANRNKYNRSRNIIWYNSPHSRNVATNIGKTFLEIIDKEFPLGHTLHKIFNRNTIKISYSCITNIKQIIDGHNKTKLSSSNIACEKVLCNCRRKDECPIQNKCLADSIVYQATVTTND